MPDVKRSKDRIARLSVSCLPHCDEFLGKIRGAHSGFQKLYLLEVDQDAVQPFRMPLDLLLKCSLRLRPRDDVDVRSLALAESLEILDSRVRLQASKTDPDVAISHETRSRLQLLEPLPHRGLASKKKRLGQLAFTAQFERAEILVP